MDDIAVNSVTPGSPELEQVIGLYRQHSATLGFLPRGAFEDFAYAGRVLAASRNEELLGYLAYRLGRGGEAVIVHLCVANPYRRTGVSRALVDRMVADCPTVPCIRLSCREDYAANALWPRLGFVIEGSRIGRGGDAARLLTWRREVTRTLPLLDYWKSAEAAGRRVAVLDANVFFDLDDETERGEESRALLADWVSAEITLRVTAELHNEIENSSDEIKRERSIARARSFLELRAKPADLEQTYAAVCRLLPPARSRQDEADRRQLSHAIVERAHAFVTRDGALLDQADELEASFGIEVLRPLDLILQLHSDVEPSSYQPARLAGTAVLTAAPTEQERALVEDSFQQWSSGEPRAAWLSLCREVLSSPHRYTCRLVRGAPHEKPFLFYAIDRAASERVVIRVLRVVSHPLATTILQRVLLDLVVNALGDNDGLVVLCEDAVGRVAQSALEGAGFSKSNIGWLREARRQIVPLSELKQLDICGSHPEPATELEDGPAAAERRLWPLKVDGADLPCFIVPIEPYWAGALFDERLAERRLFGVPTGIALALENVYYSRSRRRIPEGARVLWYVSSDEREVVRQVRAVSLSLGTDCDSAKTLFGRYRRLGVFQWPDVCAAAKGPTGKLWAYRFSLTEPLSVPVPWDGLQEALIRHTGRTNQIQSPLRIPESMFFELYRRGTGR